MQKTAFDNEQYLKTQSQHIRQRIAQFGGKLYLEFGGKLGDPLADMLGLGLQILLIVKCRLLHKQAHASLQN